ncbi:epidermal retinol dehydrogenase 2-like [Saccoglossus kowalevskii]|uniref:Epidermal retinol dehydrogenase 2-like n=1 Tax=Saccoglossus kowalevskii TaxID=10224 RepID=A0ABM0GRU7_SACKO|nr:PREDICTED: epidermal retinol dehydrogenase 2-like [Saccoglossus kowalevskii]
MCNQRVSTDQNIVSALNIVQTSMMSFLHDGFQLFLELLTVLWRVFLSCTLVFYRWVMPLDPKIIRGEIVLVTGAAGHLGRAIALEFAKKGCVLVLWDIDEAGNEATATDIREYGGVVFTYLCDCRKRIEIYRVATQVKKEVGDVSIIVNNAGTVVGKSFLDTEDCLVEDTVNVNMMAHFWTTKAFITSMLDKNHGHIVNITSSAGYIAVNGLTDYCASKFGAAGLCECLMYEMSALKKDGVHMTNVVPYYFEFGMFEGCRTRFTKLFPPLSKQTVVMAIMDGVLRNECMVFIPWYIKPMTAIKMLLPVDAFITLMDFLGTTSFMENFHRNKKF